MIDEKRIRSIVKDVLDKELKSLLRDVTYRLGCWTSEPSSSWEPRTGLPPAC